MAKSKFSKAKKLVDRAKISGFKKEGEMGDCIADLSDAITIMEGILPNFVVEEINQYLCEAYCLRALFEHNATPKSEGIVNDLKAALSIWLNTNTLPTTIMFYNIIDLAQMKGSMELSNEVHSLLIKIFKQTSTDSIMDWFTTLWLARRLNHPFCNSPVNEKLIHDYTEPCLPKELQESLASLYKEANDNAEHFVQRVSKEADPSYTFAQAYVHLEKSRWHTCTGDIKEALLHALKSHEYFEKIASEAQEVISKEIEVCLLKNTEIDFKGTYITPWKAIQGYLECLLQLGIIHERMGHGIEAESVLHKGLNICNSFEFPLPYLLFSIHIEKLYARGLKKLPDKVNLPDAMEIFKNSKGQWGCLKCNSLIQCTLYGDHSDLFKSKSTTKAKENYTAAVIEINSSLWKNRVSCNSVEPNEAFRANVWQDISSQVSKSKSLDDLVNLKWECVRRQLAVELYIGLGKCYSESEVDEASKILLQNISLLAGRNPFDYTPTSINMDLVAIESPGDMFSIQRAEVIHSICWYCLKNYHTKFVRKNFGHLSPIIFARIASSLKVAFVLSRGVPLILREVSTLLSVMYVVSVSCKKLSLTSICNDLSESIWSAYFHQISIGTNLTNKFHLKLTEIFKGQHVTKSSSMFDSLGYIPNSSNDLTEHVRKFMVGLSSATITCLSVLGSKYVGLLQVLPLSHFLCKDTNAVMLVSRLNFETDPFTMMQHIPNSFEVDTFLRRLRRIVKSVTIPQMQNMMSFHREELRRDGVLTTELSNLEESWFGPWKCLFQGQALDCDEIMDKVLERLLEELGHISDSVHVIKSLLKLLLECYQSIGVKNLEAGLRTKNESCFIAKKGYYEALNAMLPKKNRDNTFERAFRHAFDSMKRHSLVRKPIIFVFDSQLQTIPWENMPIGRDQEIYRMPSVSSVFTVLDYHKRRNSKEQLRSNSVLLPSMDPLDAFYVINPNSDPANSFEYVESITKSLEGCKNREPTDEELAFNIKKHDLFMYYGHKAALPSSKHISSINTAKESCAVVKLMGCKTVDYQLQGKYAPKCRPYSYLLVGSPAVFANLWMVTDQEMDSLGGALYDEWVKERSSNDEDRHGVAAFMPRARKACRYPFLTGAATVCYGVPTKICKKDNKRKRSE